MKCVTCGASFTNFKAIFRHIKTEHAIKQGTNNIYNCEVFSCRQKFSNFWRFKRHLLRCHADNFNFDSDQVNDCASYQAETVSFSSDCVYSSNENPKTSKNVPKHENVHTPILIPTTDNTNPNFNCDIFLQQITECALKFCLSLHNKNNFTRKDIIDIQDKVQKLVLNPVLDIIKSFCNSNESFTGVQFINEFHTLINSLRNPFKNFPSDYLLYESLKRKDIVKDLTQFEIDNQIGVVDIDHYGETMKTGVTLPIKFQIKKIFEKDGFLNEMLQYMQSLESQSQKLNNFIQGSIWQEKKELYPEKILIPYFLYEDELEINNPLGSHSSRHSISNIYYSFPCMKASSKLDEIYLAAVIKTRDIKEHGNEKCLYNLVQQLKEIEINGIMISHNGVEIQVHFILGLVIGDNLSLNTILGFNNFSSKSFCRMCYAKKSETQVSCNENKDNLRTIASYELDLKRENPEDAGIKSVSIFNDIPSFHVVNNFCVDIMHDIYEGICHYNLSHILIYLTQTMKYFTLDQLNHRKTFFDYGDCESGYNLPDIKISHLKKKHLKMSAKEMMTFVHYFPLIVGDFVPPDDEVWNFTINFLEIIDILLCFEIDLNIVNSLQKKIEVHNREYVTLFNDTLKPKHHNLLHYPTVIQRAGPLRKLWCFKFEGKHKQFKIYSHCITSRKNIPVSLSKKYQLKFAYYILNEQKSELEFELDEKHKISGSFHRIIENKLQINKKDDLKFYQQIHFQSQLYKKGYYVTKFGADVEIYIILEIIILRNNEPLLFCQRVLDIQYCPHFLSFEVVNQNSWGEFSILKIRKLLGPPLNINKTARGSNMIRVKQYFQSSFE